MTVPFTNGVSAERGTSRLRHRWHRLGVVLLCAAYKMVKMRKSAFFTNVTFTAVAEISIRGDFFSKAIINSLSLTCFSFISFYSELTSLYISTPYTYQVWIYRIPFMIWKLQTTFSNLSSMKVFEFQLQFHWSLFPRVQLIISQHWFR